VSELPDALRQSLPAFTVSVALYSEDAASRMARINDQVVREGQQLSAGLRVEEITRDSIILSYQNYRFRVGLK
jgi:general secretion pathway protein B